MRNKICPYCLVEDKFDKRGKKDYVCPACNSTIPPMYAANKRVPLEVISAVGFRGHGKTLYFSSLFYSMEELATIWKGFYYCAADEKGLDTINDNKEELKKGHLPHPTPASFPSPTIVEFCKMGALGKRFFIFYDTGGETYEKASKVIKYADFVKRSKTVIFLISLKDIEYDGSRMHDLLNVYVQGLTEMGGNPKDQHLLVVFSKGDELRPRLANNKQIWQYLVKGKLKNLGKIRMRKYIRGMNKVSSDLREFAVKELEADNFINFAVDRFKSTDFSIISSLGAEPLGNRLLVEIIPKCIFDPLLWVTYKSLNRFRKIFFLLRNVL